MSNIIEFPSKVDDIDKMNGLEVHHLLFQCVSKLDYTEYDDYMLMKKILEENFVVNFE